MRFRLLDIVTGDIAFEAYGKNLNELFENIGIALTEIMTDIKSIKQLIKKEFVIESEDLNALIFDFISEILFLKDAEGIVFSYFKIKIKKHKKYTLHCIANGDRLSVDKHKIKMDIKAATYHQMKVKKSNGWKARVILDV